MFIEIPDDVVENIVLQDLKKNHESSLEVLIKTLKDEDDDSFTAVYSFDFDEEVFGLITEVRAFERLIEYYGGTVKYSVSTMLKEMDSEIYETEKSISELKSENQNLIRKVKNLTEKLEGMTYKIKNILG